MISPGDLVQSSYKLPPNLMFVLAFYSYFSVSFRPFPIVRCAKIFGLCVASVLKVVQPAGIGREEQKALGCFV